MTCSNIQRPQKLSSFFEHDFNLLSCSVVRISCTNFPKYFAILTRIKEEVRAIGAEGGKVVASHSPNVQGFFPVGALQKKIKVALQVQSVPQRVLQLTCPNMGLRFSPLVAIEPRRRRFHVAVQVAVPLSGGCFKLCIHFHRKEAEAEARITLLCLFYFRIQRCIPRATLMFACGQQHT